MEALTFLTQKAEFLHFDLKFQIAQKAANLISLFILYFELEMLRRFWKVVYGKWACGGFFLLIPVIFSG